MLTENGDVDDENKSSNSYIEAKNKNRYFYDLTLSEILETSRDDVGRTLKTFTGVFCPVALAQFSTLLFLRTGFVVGQAGLVYTLLQLLLAYSILILTILSICAVSTNGAVKGGGVYFMISRTLGPEVGGSIGIFFYLGNIFSCALYISGFVEGLVNNFGPDGLLLNAESNNIPDGVWWRYLYATLVCLFCFAVCMIGSSMFAKTSLIIFVTVLVCLISVIITLIFHSPMSVVISRNNKLIYKNSSYPDDYANFTGFRWATLSKNVLYKVFKRDYTTGNGMNFLTVFAILFAGVTGIMNGANMSGELKNPSRSIPQGTLGATVFTLLCYVLVSFLTAATCTRKLLLNNYLYMQSVNYWPPFVMIGIFATTLSAALGNLIGASRVLHALAMDNIFGILLDPVKRTIRGNNPIVSVMISFILVQLVLLIGQVNKIAPAVSVFFLLAYASVNLACALLDLAGASNFRPEFKYFTWYSSILGMLGCLIMCFLINFEYAIGLFLSFVVLIVVLNFRHMDHAWGSIGQALLYHQVRKYLLLLDNRKDHVKYWRPQVLLLVSNPRTQANLVTFINSLKKGGLFVLGHVIKGNFEDMPDDPCNQRHRSFLEVKDYLKVKAFVDITVAQTVRDGCRNLVRLSGLGGMTINTVCLGFWDTATPQDILVILEKEKQLKKAKMWPFKGIIKDSSNQPDISQSNDRQIMDTESGINKNYDSSEEKLDGVVDSNNPSIQIDDKSPLVERRKTITDYMSMKKPLHIKMKKITESKQTDGKKKKLQFLDDLPNIRNVKSSSENINMLSRSSSSEAILDNYGSHNNMPSEIVENSQLSHREYLGIIEDCIKMKKNICLCRHFDNLDKLNLHKSRHTQYVDVWPINFFQPGSGSYLDNSCKLMLQLSCILSRSSQWSSELKIRVFICLDYYSESSTNDTTTNKNGVESLWRELLRQWRIPAEICLVQWDDILVSLEQELGCQLLASIVPASDENTARRVMSEFNPKLPTSYVRQVNTMIKSRISMTDTAVCFFYLPLPPQTGSTDNSAYLNQLTMLTEELPPSVFVCGQQEVMTVAL